MAIGESFASLVHRYMVCNSRTP